MRLKIIRKANSKIVHETFTMQNQDPLEIVEGDEQARALAQFREVQQEEGEAIHRQQGQSHHAQWAHHRATEVPDQGFDQQEWDARISTSS